MPAEAGAAEAAVLRIHQLSCRFGGLRAVDNVDLSVARGERRAILGPNGAGKTTLFNLISGDVFPTAGRIEVFGQDATSTPARKRIKLGITRTYQTSRLFLPLTVLENVYLAILGVAGGHLRPLRLPQDRAYREQARALAERVGLRDRIAVTVGSLSHGEQRQLEIALALAGSPRIMMLDEPAAGLSPAERGALTELLLSLDPSVTLLVVEHDMDVALRVAQVVTVMHEGRIVAEGSTAEIRANPLVHDLYLGRGYSSRSASDARS
ncbi:MAG TPA: ABC transporter ATP-binding protein [Candidatus Limnocylindrales bacterium]|nr:ABC transporter ATP-binding protein [Candidatus Limnocylindrales bacterium]